MTYLTFFHWLLLGVLGGLYVLVTMVMLRKLRGQFLAVGILIWTLSIFAIASIGMISLDKQTKKVTIDDLENKRNLRSETLVFTGYVSNVGDFTVGEVTLSIKLINKGSAAGTVKGTDFYQTNNFWEMMFSAKGDKKAKPNTITIERVIATNLKPEERRAFSVDFAFPTYFSDVAFRTTVSAH
ncbi:MAG: hypothetical protein KU28_01125 [Sulfurovum sp. PC08-66]|nr:MAG: hypothetical protein KU28_01125 [Sulfurovum sp. PC08-66]KIM12558.1 MAG: hypothetical protein KU37_01240 [Sulfuricurvum sp. PC08-66]